MCQIINHELPSAGRPSGIKITAAAADNVDTMPMDLRDVPIPDSLVPTSSPEVASEKRREQYQRTSRAPPTVDQSSNVTWDYFNMHGGGDIHSHTNLNDQSI